MLQVTELKPAQFVGNLIGSANASGLFHEWFGSSPEECNPWVLIDQRTDLLVCVPVKAFAWRKAKGNHCQVLVEKSGISCERVNCNAKGCDKRVF